MSIFAQSPFSTVPFGAIEDGERSVAAAAGAFALTGEAAFFVRDYVLGAEAGAVVLAGQDAEFLKGFSLASDAGAFALTGEDAGSVRGIVLASGAGSFSLAGQSAALVRTHLFSADAGAVVLAGQDAPAIRGYLFASDAGAIGLTGQMAALVYQQRPQPLAVLLDRDLLGDPILLFDGRLDTGTIEDGGDRSAIILSYESRLIDLERARERRYTDEDQRIDYPEDAGFAYVAALQDQVFTWGRG